MPSCSGALIKDFLGRSRADKDSGLVGIIEESKFRTRSKTVIKIDTKMVKKRVRDPEVLTEAPASQVEDDSGSDDVYTQPSFCTLC